MLKYELWWIGVVLCCLIGSYKVNSISSVFCGLRLISLSDIKPISAKNGEGVEELKKYLFESQKSKIQGTDQVLITNARHHSALQQALRYLKQLKSGLTTSLPGDLLSEDLRATVAVLSEITGQISSQDVLIRVFRGFCIGK